MKMLRKRFPTLLKGFIFMDQNYQNDREFFRDTVAAVLPQQLPKLSWDKVLIAIGDTQYHHPFVASEFASIWVRDDIAIVRAVWFVPGPYHAGGKRRLENHYAHANLFRGEP